MKPMISKRIFKDWSAGLDHILTSPIPYKWYKLEGNTLHYVV